MYLWSALISASALAVGLIDGRVAVGAVVLGALVLFVVTAFPRLERWRASEETVAEPAAVPPPTSTIDDTAPGASR
jgi:hypothetical protein